MLPGGREEGKRKARARSGLEADALSGCQNSLASPFTACSAWPGLPAAVGRGGPRPQEGNCGSTGGMRPALNLPMRFPVLFLSLLLPAVVQARIGESVTQFADRYGAPKDTVATKTADKMSPLVEGAIHRAYEYQGWKIRAAFLQLDGPCVRMDYQKILAAGIKPQIEDYELQAIAAANTPPGVQWTKIAYRNPDLSINPLSQAIGGAIMGQKVWQRTDGAILWLRSGLIVRLELPAA